MAYGRAVGAAGEAAVGEQGHVLAEADAGDGCGGGEHFAHAGAAAGAFVEDDHAVAGLDLAVEDGLHGVLLAVEDLGLHVAAQHFRRHGGLLDHAAVGGDVAAQHGDAAVLEVGIVDGSHDLVVEDMGAGFADVLPHGLAGDGEAVLVDEARLVQLAHDGEYAAGLVEVGHVVLARRGEVAEVGSLAADLVEDVQVDVEAGLAEDGWQVEHGVGGAAEGHVDGDGVLHALAGHDVERADVVLQEIHDAHAGVLGQADAGCVDGGDGAVAGQGDAYGLGEAVHGVGGEHAGAGAAAGTGLLLHDVELFLGELAGLEAANGLEHGNEVCVLAAGRVAGKHGAAGDEDRGQVQAHHGHEHAGHALVAVGDEDETVEGMGPGHDLAAVGDVVPGGQGEAHALVVHGYAVAYGDGGKFDGRAAGHADAGLDGLGYPVEMHVAGHDFVGGVHNADEGAGDLLLGQAEGVEQGSVRGLFQALLHQAALLVVHEKTSR